MKLETVIFTTCYLFTEMYTVVILVFITMRTSNGVVIFYDIPCVTCFRTEKRKWLCTLFIGTSALYASRTSVPLLVPAIALERNWSKTNSGTVLSSFFWGYTLTQVVGGYLSDRIGGHKVILTAALGWSLFTFWMPGVIRLFSAPETSVNFIVIMRILHGAFQGMVFAELYNLVSLGANKITFSGSW